MRKIYVLLLVLVTSIAAFAQKSSRRHATLRQPAGDLRTYARTTGTGDTVTLSNTIGDNIVLYSVGADSGYLAGTNYWNDKAFAERYDFAGTDSTMKVVGALAKFGGTVSSTSTKSITFNVWGIGNPRYITAGMYYGGFPTVSVFSYSVPLTQVVPGTMQQFMFNSGSGILSGSFYFGYNIDYAFTTLNGDSIGLYSSEDGDRNSPASYLNVTISGTDTTIDTIINVQNATRWSDGSWHDNYTDNDSLFNDLAIYPIVMIWHPTGVKGITRKELTFYGSYPNPAKDYTNIKLSLVRQADVTIQVMDMAGRQVSTTTQIQLTAGEHIIPVSTSALPAGEYLYLIRTSTGDGIASKMTVIK